MHHFLFAIALSAFPSALLAQTVQVEVRYVEINVTAHAAATNAYLATKDKHFAAGSVDKLSDSAKEFVTAMSESKAPFVRDVTASGSIDDNSETILQRGSGSGTEPDVLTAKCRRRKTGGIDINVEYASKTPGEVFKRASSFGLGSDSNGRELYFPLGANNHGKGASASRRAIFFIVRFSETKSD
jgi:hypothetical protein